MRFNLSLLTITFFFFGTSNAYAYLDPGTGSMILQAVIGAIATGMFFARMYWEKFKQLAGFGNHANASSSKADDENAK